MTRELEPSILSLLAEHGTMTAEKIAEFLESDTESVDAALEQMKHSQWVIDTGDGHWRAARSGHDSIGD